MQIQGVKLVYTCSESQFSYPLLFFAIGFIALNFKNVRSPSSPMGSEVACQASSLDLNYT